MFCKKYNLLISKLLFILRTVTSKIYRLLHLNTYLKIASTLPLPDQYPKPPPIVQA